MAASGLPTHAALVAEFDRAIESVAPASTVPDSAGTVDRLWKSAEGLVSVRSAQPTTGTDPVAIVSRIRGALAAGDLATALKERAALPDPYQAATADWAKSAQARLDADALVERVRASALAKLGGAG
jgi:hypothetical protein